MSHDHSDHAHDDYVHHPHVLPLKIYFGVAAALLFLTWVTVAVSYFDAGPFQVPIALAVASLKASLVALFFMHLKYEDKFYGLVFVAAFIFLSLFFIFTLADTERRGEVDVLEQGTIEVLPKSSIPHLDDGHGEGAHGGDDAHGEGSHGEDSSHGGATDPGGDDSHGNEDH